MATIKSKDKEYKCKDCVEDEFTQYQGMTCNKCGEIISNDFGDMKSHLEDSHDMEIEA